MNAVFAGDIGHCQLCDTEAELLEHPYAPLLMVCFDCRMGLIANWEEPIDKRIKEG